MKPGKDEEEFKITLNTNTYSKRIVIYNNNLQLHWFWSMIGFSVAFDTVILTEPKLVEDSYVYDVELVNKIYYWLNFKLKTIKL